VTQVQIIREIKWATSTCTLSFNTFGIWVNTNESNGGGGGGGGSMDGTDINACCASVSNGLLATVDDFGKLNLYAYPCASAKGAEKKTYQGHSSHVTNVTFVNGDTRLITCGGNDMAVFQWAIVKE
jgi:echinoderm microtubule-associated protein-like 1/2